MTAYLRNPLTLVWALLTAVTLASWLISSETSTVQDRHVWVALAVLGIGALKAQLVVMYFMEVRHGPRWLKWTIYGWVALLFGALLAAYSLG